MQIDDIGGSDTSRRILIDATIALAGGFSTIKIEGQWKDSRSKKCYEYYAAKQEQQHNSLAGSVIFCVVLLQYRTCLVISDWQYDAEMR